MARLFYTEAQESTPLYWKLKFNQCVTRIQSSPVFNRTGFILSDRRGMEGLAESRCQEGQMDKLFSQPGGFLHAYQKQKSLKKNWQNKTPLCSQEKRLTLQFITKQYSFKTQNLWCDQGGSRIVNCHPLWALSQPIRQRISLGDLFRWEPKRKFFVKLEGEPHCPELQHFSTEDLSSMKQICSLG